MGSVWLAFCDCSFHSIRPLRDKDKRLMESSWWDRLTVEETGPWLTLVGCNCWWLWQTCLLICQEIVHFSYGCSIHHQFCGIFSGRCGSTVLLKLLCARWSPWQIDGETMETATLSGGRGSKIIADGDCSHEIQRRSLEEKLWPT